MKVNLRKMLALVLCFAMAFSLCSGLVVSNAAAERKTISTTYMNCGVNKHLKTEISANFIGDYQISGSLSTKESREDCVDENKDGMCDICNTALSSEENPQFKYVFSLEYDEDDDSLVKITVSIVRTDIQDGATYLIRGIDFTSRFGEGLSPVYTSSDKKDSEFAEVLIPSAYMENNVEVPITVNEGKGDKSGNLKYQAKNPDTLSNPDVNQYLQLTFDNLEQMQRGGGYITMNKEQPIYSFKIKKDDLSNGLKNMDVYKEKFLIYLPLDGTKYTGDGEDIDLATPKLIYDPNGTVLTYKNMSYGKNCPESVYMEEYPKVDGKYQEVTSLISSNNMVTPTGYTFDGWHVKTSTGMTEAKLDISRKNPLVMNTTWYLIAKWEPIKYTATYVNKYGTEVPTDNPIYLTVEDPTIDDDKVPDVPTINGYTGKWQDNPFDPSKPSNVIIKPEYTPIDYTITYDAAGGTIVEGNDSPQSYTVEDKITLRTAARKGYTFKGWTVEGSSDQQTGARLDNWGNTISKSTTTVGPSKYGNVKLTAIWEKNSYTVTWKGGNKGTVKNTSGKMVTSFTQTVPYGETLVFPDAARAEAKIDGWSVDDSGDKELDADGKGIQTETAGGVNVIKGQLPAMPDANITITVIWDATRYPLTVNYVMSDKSTVPAKDKDGNDVKSGEAITYEYEQEYSIKTPQFTGYTASRTYINGTMPAEPKTEVVIYTPNNHKIEWNADGGKVNDKNNNNNPVSSYSESVVYGQDLGKITTPSDPVRDGYTFDGWTAKDGDKEITPKDLLKNGSKMPDKDYTFTAKWKAIPYTIALNLNGGELDDDAWTVYKDGDPVRDELVDGESNELAPIEYWMNYSADSTEKLPTAARSGYTLKGWKVTVVLPDRQTAVPSWILGKTYSKNYSLNGTYGYVRLDAVWGSGSNSRSDSNTTPDKDTDTDTDPTEPDKKTDILDTANHYSYLCGYDKNKDGIAEVIQPEKSITRAEIATVFFRLLDDDVRTKYLTKTNSYSDVDAIWWYNTAISTLTNAGIINGYKDGTFRPQTPVTRAELAVMLTRFLKTELQQSTEDAGFADVSVTTHWAYKEICIAANAGLIEGYTVNGTKLFKPEKDITRAETATMINRILNRNPKSTTDLLKSMKKFYDNSNTSAWYYLAMQEASNSHDYVRDIYGTETWTELIESPDWLAYEK